MAPQSRTLRDVEADLRIQSVLVAHERSRHAVADNDPDVLRLDAPLDEWAALQPPSA